MRKIFKDILRASWLCWTFAQSSAVIQPHAFVQIFAFEFSSVLALKISWIWRDDIGWMESWCPARLLYQGELCLSIRLSVCMSDSLVVIPCLSVCHVSSFNECLFVRVNVWANAIATLALKSWKRWEIEWNVHFCVDFAINYLSCTSIVFDKNKKQIFFSNFYLRVINFYLIFDLLFKNIKVLI